MREKVLMALEPKPKEQAKPSRLYVKAKFIPEDSSLLLKQYYLQKGVIDWRHELKAM